MGPRVGSIAQLTIHKEAVMGEKTRNALFKQRREGEMDPRLCGYRDRCGTKVSSIRRDSDHARAGRYEKC